MTGVLAGIARHARPRGPIEELERVSVSMAGGLAGDFRGAVKPGGRARRQVSLLGARDWATATAELGVDLRWSVRRANLLVDGLDLPQVAGTRMRIGSILLEVTQECDPCSRMDAIVQGLKAALTPDWRGGVLARVIEGGEIALGDTIRIEE